MKRKKKNKSIHKKIHTFYQSSAVRISFIYFIISTLWIFFSDRIISQFVSNADKITFLQTIKGSFFVLVTTFIIFLLIYKEVKRKNEIIKTINKSEKWYNRLVANLPSTNVYLFNHDMNILLAQGTELLKTSLDPQKTVGKKLDVLPTDALKDKFIGFFSEVLKGNEIAVEIKKDDNWFELRSAPLKDKNNQVYAGVAVLMNITSRKLSEQKILESESKFRSIFDYAPIGIALVSPKGIPFLQNKALQEMLGYSSEELKTKRFKNFTHSEDIKKDVILFNELYARKISSYQIDKRFIHKKGHTVWGSLTVSPIIKDNKVHSALAMVLDITKRKKDESELKNSKKRAEESDRLKSAFIANISHEIRTPMNAIIGFSDLLIQEEDPATRKQYVKNIKISSEQLLVIINDILDISKIESGAISIKKQKISLSKLIREIKSTYETKAAKKNITIKCNYPKHEINDEIITDPNRLAQIINNLMNNALKFTSQGSIELNYELSKNKKWLKFSIVDTGIGINSNELDVIFHRFRQADERHTRKFGGTGLGLSIVKALVEKFGGEIGVSSQPEKGSKFYFTIPYQPYNVKKDKSLEQLVSSFDKFTNKTILVVEDDDLSFELIERALQKTGIKIDRAKNGQQAVEYCAQKKYIDIVLMDIQLPVLNGFEATQIIKKFRKNLVIIAHTAYTHQEEKELCFQSGCVDFIPKPLNPQQLYQVLKQHMAFDTATNNA